MKKIPLTHGQFALVDDWQYKHLMQWKWMAQWNKDTNSFYAVRYSGILMHREIMKTKKKMICDHKNHNTLDNQEINLRNVSASQSIMNTKVRKDSKLGIKGIRKRGNSYQVNIVFEGKKVLCKMFSNLDDAMKAHAEATQIYFGEFSHINSSK